MTADICKVCRGPIKVVYALDVLAYPYAPEWPMERIDAGRFCSPECLADYLRGVQ